MAKGRNIGATLSLKAGNFFANMKKAQNESNNLRSTLNNTSKKFLNWEIKLKLLAVPLVNWAKG